MSSTKDMILGLGEELIRTRGYHAFSYKDIAQALNVKNAAIHYHFPSKEDLGIAIIQKSIDGFHALAAYWNQVSYKQQLKDVIRIYERSNDQKWCCLMGALSASAPTLPAKMQEKLGEMAAMILDRVTLILEKGRKAGQFAFEEHPRQKAQLIISSLLSSLLLERVLEEDIFESITDTIIKTVIIQNKHV